MGKVNVHNLSAVRPGVVKLHSVGYGESIYISHAIPVKGIAMIEPGVYIRTHVDVSGFIRTQPESFDTFININTGKTRMLPLWIDAESVDLTVNFRRSK